MKRLSIKRLNILNKPMPIADMTEQDNEIYEDRWLLKADKLQTKQIRRWRQQLSM